MSNIFSLASKFEYKLSKLANLPDQQSIHNIIVNVVDTYKSNPLLKTTKVAPEVYLSGGSFGDKMSVYFQLITDAKNYSYLMSEPQKTEITSILKPAIEKSLEQYFRAYSFDVKIGIVS